MTAINHKEKKNQSEKKQSYQGSYSTLNYLPQVSLAEPFLLLPWELLSWSACARPLWAPQGDTVTLLCEDRDCQSLPPHPQGEPGAAEGGGCPYLQFQSALCWGQQRWSCSSPQNNLVPGSQGTFPTGKQTSSSFSWCGKGTIFILFNRRSPRSNWCISSLAHWDEFGRK